MATVTRRCRNAPKCKIRFRVPSQSRRQFCETCRPPRSPAGTATTGRTGPEPGPGPVETRAMAELVAVDRHETVPGLLVLAVARDIDQDRVKPEQKGQAGQRLLALLAVALAGTAPSRKADALDDLAARRAAKEAAAS